MTKGEFLASLDEMMGEKAGTLKGGEQLKDLPNWDSMTLVQFVAFADEEFSLPVSTAKLISCHSVDDLAALLSPHVTD
jgi:acyl carrier protein